MIPYSIEIIGRDEPIDAVKVAYAHMRGSDGNFRHFCYILTPDMRIASFDIECPSHILWENTPDQEAINFVNNLFDQMMAAQNKERPKKEHGVQYQ